MNQQEQFETEEAEMALDEEVPGYNEQRAEAIYRILKKYHIHRVLDVGCGLGKVTVYLAEKGLDVMGIDISPRLVELAQKKAQEHHVPIEFQVSELAHYIPKEKFDGVLFAGVLEHIENEEQLMHDAKRVLKEDGKMVIFDIPLFPWLYHPRDKRVGHLRRYTKKVVKRRLLTQGYIPIELTPYNFLMFFGSLYLLLFKKEEYPYGAVNRLTNKLLHLWYKHLENNFIFPVGDRLIAVAQVGKERSP